jgi:hypothetical protein
LIVRPTLGMLRARTQLAKASPWIIGSLSILTIFPFDGSRQ